MRKEASLPRSVGFWGTALFPVNGMIGSGIFALPAILVAAVGNFAPWMMLLGALLILPLAFVFAALATRFDSHGGAVLYTQTAFGSFIGFQTGWSRYASGVVSAAANTKVAVAYLAALFPVLEDPLVNGIAVIGFIGFITIVNIIGMRTSVGALGLMTVIKLSPLVILVLVGLATRDPAVGFDLPQFTEVESVVLLTFYAYMAFENATFPAGEVRNPKRNIPLALITTLFAVALFYMLVIWAYLSIAPEVTDHQSALAAAAGNLFADAGVVVISLAAAFSIGANILAGGTVIPRVTYGMAEQGTLPKAFAYVSSRFQSPYFSILFYGGAAILFSLWGGFVVLAVAGTLSRIVMYLLTAFALPVLQWKSNERTPWWHYLMVLLATVSCIWVASHASVDAYQMLVFILVAGTALYFLAARTNHQVPQKTIG